MELTKNTGEVNMYGHCVVIIHVKINIPWFIHVYEMKY